MYQSSAAATTTALLVVTALFAPFGGRAATTTAVAGTESDDDGGFAKAGPLDKNKIINILPPDSKACSNVVPAPDRTFFYAFCRSFSDENQLFRYDVYGNLVSNITFGHFHPVAYEYMSSSYAVNNEAGPYGGMDVDATDGSIYIGGMTNQSFLGGVVDDNSVNGYTDGFVSKFTQYGEHVWTKMFGDFYGEWVLGLEVDQATRKVYVTGSSDAITKNDRMGKPTIWGFDKDGTQLFANQLSTSSGFLQGIEIVNSQIWVVGYRYQYNYECKLNQHGGIIRCRDGWYARYTDVTYDPLRDVMLLVGETRYPFSGGDAWVDIHDSDDLLTDLGRDFLVNSNKAEHFNSAVVHPFNYFYYCFGVNNEGTITGNTNDTHGGIDNIIARINITSREYETIQFGSSGHDKLYDGNVLAHGELVMAGLWNGRGAVYLYNELLVDPQTTRTTTTATSTSTSTTFTTGTTSYTTTTGTTTTPSSTPGPVLVNQNAVETERNTVVLVSSVVAVLGVVILLGVGCFFYFRRVTKKTEFDQNFNVAMTSNMPLGLTTMGGGGNTGNTVMALSAAQGYMPGMTMMGATAMGATAMGTAAMNVSMAPSSEVVVPPLLEKNEGQHYIIGDVITTTTNNTEIREATIVDEELVTRTKSFKSNVVVKVMPTGVGQMPPHIRMAFQQEVMLLYKFRDVPFFAKLVAFSNEPRATLLLRNYPVGSLMSFIIGKGDVSESHKYTLLALTKIFLAVSKAVTFLHNNDVSHNDLKPSAILLDLNSSKQLTAVLTDFGAARLLNPKDLMGQQVDIASLRPLSSQYAAPEAIERFQQHRDDKDSSMWRAGDRYSLGVSILQALERKEQLWPAPPAPEPVPEPEPTPAADESPAAPAEPAADAAPEEPKQAEEPSAPAPEEAKPAEDAPPVVEETPAPAAPVEDTPAPAAEETPAPPAEDAPAAPPADE